MIEINKAKIKPRTATLTDQISSYRPLSWSPHCIVVGIIIFQNLIIHCTRTLSIGNSFNLGACPVSMEDYGRSGSYGNGQTMQMESYYGSSAPRSYDLRCCSASYAQTQVGLGPIPNPKELKSKKGKSTAGSSLSKSWSLGDPEFQRKKRVASYKMYSVEGKVKGSLRKSFRWLKDRYYQVVYGWW